jgi:hypothetical protein
LRHRKPVLRIIVKEPGETIVPDKPAVTAPVVTENIPANAGQISAIASANAPFIYFESVPFFGLFNGIAQITLEASRMIATAPDGRAAVDRVVVAHLRSNLPALRSLRTAIDAILLMAEPTPEGPAN